LHRATAAWQNVRVTRSSGAARWLACAVLVAACGGERQHEGDRTPSQAEPAPPASMDPEPSTAEPETLRTGPTAPPAPCGDADQCYAKAIEAERANDGPRAAELLDHACSLESGQACFRLGTLIRDGAGARANEARSRELFERGCRYGSTSACDAVGH
jgi:hypothetical protein